MNQLPDASKLRVFQLPALVLVSALVSIFIIAACAPVAAPTVTPPTTAPSTQATAAPAIAVLSDKKVGLSSPVEIEILNEFYADMRKEGSLPANMVKLDVVDAGGDPVKQTTDLEAFLAQGYDGIFVLALSPGGLDDFVKRATDKGVCVFNHSPSAITNATQSVILDQYASGYEVGKVAAEWINKRGGELEVAYLISSSDPQIIRRSQGQKDAIKALAPKAKIVGEAEANTIDLGASATANLLQAHPNLSVLLAFSDDGGLGAYQAATEAGKKDPNTFFIGSLDGTNLALEKIAEKGIYQTTWSYLFAFSSVQWMRDMEKCLRGEKVPPARTQIGRIVTLENLEEIRNMVANPLDPAVQKFYSDPGVMKYSDVPLMTPK